MITHTDQLTQIRRSCGQRVGKAPIKCHCWSVPVGFSHGLVNWIHSPRRIIIIEFTIDAIVNKQWAKTAILSSPSTIAVELAVCYHHHGNKSTWTITTAVSMLVTIGTIISAQITIITIYIINMYAALFFIVIHEYYQLMSINMINRAWHFRSSPHTEAI